MDYERKYNDALKRAQQLNADNMLSDELIEEIFPELRESEDERIRKSIREAITYYWSDDTQALRDILAWLEKQKDTTSAVSINEAYESGFNNGINAVVQEPKDYGLQKEQKSVECIEFDNEFKNQVSHILASVLNKEYNYDKGFVEYTAQSLLEYARREQNLVGPNDEWIEDYWVHHKVNNPDSYDCGDEIQFDKRGFKNFCREIRNMNSDQQPAEWSEEDKEMMQNIITGLEAQIHLIYAHDEQGKAQMKARINFLMSLPERFNLQQKQEWSEEDEKNMSYLKVLIQAHSAGPKTEKELLNWLNFLRPQSIQVKELYKEVFQAARHEVALAFMEYCDKNRPNGKMCLSNSECNDIENAFSIGDWAKIERYIHKYHWKPNKKQMEILLDAGNCNYLSNKDMQTLKDLYNDLQKLL